MNPNHVDDIKRRIAEEYKREEPPVDFPKLAPIPADRYISDTFWEAEQAHLWPRSWLMAGHLEELPAVGSCKLWNELGVPIVIVKDEQGQCRAFYNTCQHRGGPLTVDDYAENTRLRCLYHGWTYSLQGDLIGVPDQRDFVGLDLACHRLIELKCEVWGNFIFVNQNTDAQPLVEYLAPVMAELQQFDLGELHLLEKHSLSIAANWKTCVDAFLETYHLRHIHSSTVNQLLDHKGTVISLFEHGHSRMYTPNRAGLIPPQEQFTDIQSVGELPRITNLAYSFFPNLVIPFDASGFPMLLFWPVDKRNTRMEVLWFGPGEAGNGESPQFWKDPQQQLSQDWLDRLALFDVILGEDVQFLPWQQQSMETGALKDIPLSYLERRIYHQHEAIDQLIGAENIPPTMAVVQVLSEQIEDSQGD